MPEISSLSAKWCEVDLLAGARSPKMLYGRTVRLFVSRKHLQASSLQRLPSHVSLAGLLVDLEVLKHSRAYRPFDFLRSEGNRICMQPCISKDPLLQTTFLSFLYPMGACSLKELYPKVDLKPNNLKVIENLQVIAVSRVGVRMSLLLAKQQTGSELFEAQCLLWTF